MSKPYDGPKLDKRGLPIVYWHKAEEWLEPRFPLGYKIMTGVSLVVVPALWIAMLGYSHVEGGLHHLMEKIVR
jgi:hypothetical protein